MGAMTEYEKPRTLDIEWCPDVCARAEWHPDSQFPGRGQHNCKHIKPKEVQQ